MEERILLIGGGGREHALAEELSRDGVELFACARNRNPGILALSNDFRVLNETDVSEIVEYAKTLNPTMAVVGPEPPLHEGVVDELEDVGVFTFGPPKRCAKLETDKAYQRRFMQKNEVPYIPELEVFDSKDAACDFLDTFDESAVIKPSGHAEGKGVRVVGEDVTFEEGKAYIRNHDDERFIIEERLEGEPFTVWCLVSEGSIRTLVVTRDHKRVFAGGKGPNTGGMGSYAAAETTLPYVADRHYEAAVEALRETVENATDYKGVLCGQFFLTDDGVRLVDYNVRFGDSELMNKVATMKTDLLDVFRTIRNGGPITDVEFESAATVCRYATPPGYPNEPETGLEVSLSLPPESSDVSAYYGRVNGTNDTITTTTSRSIAVCAKGATISDAGEKITEAAKRIGFGELHVRHDIGSERLVEAQTTAGRSYW